MKRISTTLAVAAVSGALLAAAVVPAMAQELTGPDATQSERGETLELLRQQHEARHAEREAAFTEALAAELGLETDRVAEALATVRAQMAEQAQAERTARLRERLDAAVQDGDLTQEQADALLEAADSGVLGRFPGRGGHRRGPGGPGGFGLGFGFGFGPGAVGLEAAASSA